MLIVLKRIAAIAALATSIVAVSYGAIEMHASRLLRDDIAMRAEGWASALAAHVPNLPEVIEGKAPSLDAASYLGRTRELGNVLRYRLYGLSGRLVLASNGGDANQVTAAKLDPKVWASLAGGRPIAEIRTDRTGGKSRTISEAIVPVSSAAGTIGYLGVQLDETERQEQFVRSATSLAAFLGSLLLIAFGAPTVGFLVRSRQKERAEVRLKHLAYHDALTGLKNRNSIMQAMAGGIGLFGAGGRFAIHLVDLDNFKDINGTLGHEAGDDVLRQTSARLAEVVAGSAEAGRLGGDEFLIVQPLTDDGPSIDALARRIGGALNAPCKFRGSTLATRVNVGSASYPGDGTTSSALMKSADVAVRAAKAAGPGSCLSYRPEMDVALRRRRFVEQKIREALGHRRFELAYQPLIDLRSGRIEGAEALLRLPADQDEAIGPAEFVAVAEEHGLIAEIGKWVIAEGCRVLTLMPAHIKLAVNLSPKQFDGGDIVATVAEALTASGVAPSRLELEITESLLLDDSDRLLDQITRLKGLGVAIAIDDFGQGYSSFSYLRRFAFDKLKIDRSFVAEIDGNPKVEGIIEAIVLLAGKLGMTVTAEGVETSYQAAVLRALGCDQVQGYHFGRPMKLEDLSAAILKDFLAPQDALPPRAMTA